MKINHKILSIPPYISTSWDKITSLQAQKRESVLDLQVHLQDGSHIVIPSVDAQIVETIFFFHAKHLEEPTQKNFTSLSIPTMEAFSFSNLKLLSKLGSFCEHDPANAQAPSLPQAILDQFSSIAKSLPIPSAAHLPKPEPHCHCPYCQITKAIHHSLSSNASPVEEEISQEDLSFSSWIIESPKKDLYKVTDPDNLSTYYIVSLAPPLSCTCGKEHCSHIQAVLRS